MKKRWLYFFLLFCVGVGGGHLLSHGQKLGKKAAPASTKQVDVASGKGTNYETAACQNDRRDMSFWIRAAGFSASTDFQAEWNTLIAETPQNRSQMEYLAKRWARHAPRLALKAIEEGKQNHLKYDVYQAWGKANPEQLAAFYAEEKAAGDTPDCFDTLMSAWSSLDSASAAKWLLSRSKEEQRSGFSTVWCYALDSGNPEQMKELIGNIPVSVLNHANELEDLMQQWAWRDPGAALEWKKTLPPSHQKALSAYDKIKTDVSFQSVSKQAASNPAALRDKLVEFPTEERGQMLWNVLSRLPGEVGLDKAREWRDKYCTKELFGYNGENRELPYMIQGFYRFYQNPLQDPAEWREKVRTMPNSASRRELMQAYFETQMDKDHENNLLFLKEIKSPETDPYERHYLNEMLGRWADDEPEKALQWARQSGLDTDFERFEKDELQKRMKKSDRIQLLSK